MKNCEKLRQIIVKSWLLTIVIPLITMGIAIDEGIRKLAKLDTIRQDTYILKKDLKDSIIDYSFVNDKYILRTDIEKDYIRKSDYKKLIQENDILNSKIAELKKMLSISFKNKSILLPQNIVLTSPLGSDQSQNPVTSNFPFGIKFSWEPINYEANIIVFKDRQVVWRKNGINCDSTYQIHVKGKIEIRIELAADTSVYDSKWLLLK